MICENNFSIRCTCKINLFHCLHVNKIDLNVEHIHLEQKYLLKYHHILFLRNFFLKVILFKIQFSYNYMSFHTKCHNCSHKLFFMLT